jgi:hypothetical protein
MNIIFGNAVDQVANTHTVLELDTFKLMPSEQLIKSYCVVNTVPLSEFQKLEFNKTIHQQLIEQYRQKNWEFCRSALTVLMGNWNGEMDTFYQHLALRIDEYTNCPPDDSWTYWIVKNSD